jgi:hypothetical protein
MAWNFIYRHNFWWWLTALKALERPDTLVKISFWLRKLHISITISSGTLKIDLLSPLAKLIAFFHLFFRLIYLMLLKNSLSLEAPWISLVVIWSIPKNCVTKCTHLTFSGIRSTHVPLTSGLFDEDYTDWTRDSLN